MKRNVVFALSLVGLSFASQGLAQEEDSGTGVEPTLVVRVEDDDEPELEEEEVRRAQPPLDRHGNPRQVFPAADGLAPPVGYRLERRPLMALIYGGVGAIAGGYALSVVTSGFDYLGSHGDNPWAYSLIPLAGPFVAAAKNPDSLATGFYVASGVVQNVGLALVIIGAAIQRPFFVATGSEPVRVGFGLGSVTLSGDF